MAGVSSKTASDQVTDTMKEGQKHLTSLGTPMINAYEFLVNTIKSVPNGWAAMPWAVDILKKALSYLFDPEEGYVPLKDQIVALLGSFGETLKEDDLPSTAKPHVVQLEWNLTEARRLLENIEERITELLKFIKSNFGRSITKTELKRINLTNTMIDMDLRVCKVHVADAQAELQEVEKKMGAVLKMYGLTVAGVVGVATVGVMTSGLGVVGVACTAAATIAICRKIMEKCSSYAKWLDEFKTNKQIELKNLNQRIKVIEVKVPCLKQMMDEIEETPGCCSFAFCQWLSKLWRRRRLHH